MSTTLLPRRLALDPGAVIVVGATLLGLALRLADAGGDLGLDEVWSLGLVARVHTLGEVFWGISHDNNHLLNSAWLYLLGPGAPIWAERLPAVVLGTLTVPAFARLCGRSGPAAGALAALFAATALPLVDFGSEARGYAGLALATVLALDAAARREAWRLAVLILAQAHRRPGAAGALSLLWIAARHRLAPPWTLAIGVAALMACPLAVAALRLPNVVYARYFSVCAIALLALVAEALGTLWNQDGDARRAAAVAALSMVAGGLVLDALASVTDGTPPRPPWT